MGEVRLGLAESLPASPSLGDTGFGSWARAEGGGTSRTSASRAAEPRRGVVTVFYGGVY
jgi:hypothetical protein